MLSSALVQSFVPTTRMIDIMRIHIPTFSFALRLTFTWFWIEAWRFYFLGRLAGVVTAVETRGEFLALGNARAKLVGL